MNERTFLQRFANDIDRDRLVWLIYDEMVGYCQKNGIVTQEIGNETLEELAEGFVRRGFGVPWIDLNWEE